MNRLPFSESQFCCIRLKGHLEERWVSWFEGNELSPDDDGTTRLQGWLADQSALHGILKKIRDLGLPIISVNIGKPDE